MNTTTKPMKNVLLLNLLAATAVVIAVMATRQPALQPEGLKSADDVRAAIATAEARRQALLKADPAIPGAAILAQWGIEVVGLQRATGGHLLDFRYRVVDVDKALPLFDGRVNPYLLNERNNAQAPVPMFPKIGSLRTTNRGHNIQAGKIYSILFAGAGVQVGDRVSVVIGDFKVEHLTIR